MLIALRTAIRRWRRLVADTRAVAAVEFALVMPIMLSLYLGALEVSSLIAADRRVTVVAGTIGDLVARANKSIDVATINDYFAASAMIMSPLSTAALKQVVTQVSVDANGNAKVVWSRAHGTGATAYRKDDSYALDKTSQINLIARGGYVVIAEVSYTYTPLLGLFFHNAFTLDSTNYYLPRFGTQIKLVTS